MPPISLQQLYEQYGRLRAQLQNRQLSHQQFVDAVHQLQAQDQAGNWWTIDPQTGQYLTYTSNGWVPATPAAPQSAAQVGSRSAVQPPRQAVQASQPKPVQQQQATRKPGCLASPIVTMLLSFGAAALWFAYTSLSPSSEGRDLRTPLIIAGVPMMLRLLQKPLDSLLRPLYKLLNVLPRPLLVGAAFAVPVVLGGIFTRSGGSGFQGLQRSAFVSVIFSYILTRRPEGMA
ncbi:MAG: hypothetical protein MUQ30_09355 [Anaerolineae bacterium]|nr:hypothetical protein [Anaerolineae bacterium]